MTVDTPWAPVPGEPNLGETFVNGKTRDNARALLASADALGIDRTCVVASRGGFIVPNAVYDHMVEAALIESPDGE